MITEKISQVSSLETERSSIAIIDYGAGNVQSVLFALERLGYTGFLTSDADEILSAEKVIFPGVGEASSAMNRLREKGLDKVILQLKQPLLGICLGMQLLCKSTEEGNTTGLGIFEVAIKKFSTKVKVPQMGWNTISNLKTPLFDSIQEDEYVYLVHSYYAPLNPFTIATTNYQETYSTAIQKDNFFGVQFHPEKSGSIGEHILKNFLNLKN